MDRRVSVTVGADVGPFTAELTRAAGVAAAFQQLLDGMEDPRRIRLDVDADSAALAQFRRDLADLDDGRVNLDVNADQDGLTAFRRDVGSTSDSINQLTGRLSLARDALLTIGPATIPLAALAVPAVAGLAAQLGVATAAGGAAVLAFQGMGDALTAVEKARLEPTVENIEAARDAMAQLAPEARRFAREFAALRPALTDATVGAAAGGFFPGLLDGMDDLERGLPRVEEFFNTLGEAAGDVAGDSVESLLSDRWRPFFEYIEANAQPLLTDLVGTVGDVSYALSTMLMAGDPMAQGLSKWLRGQASDLADWADELEGSEGLTKFIDYVQTNGPKVAATASAIGGALTDIVVAAAPLAGPSLAGLEAIADVISAIADSPIGTPLLAAAAGMAALNRAMAIGGRVAAGGFFAQTSSSVATLSTGLQQAQTRAMSLRSSLAAISANRTAQASGAGVVPSWINNSQAANQAAVLASNADRARASLAGMAGAAGRVAGPMAGMGLAMSGATEEMAAGNTVMFGLMGMMAGPWGAAAGAAVGAIMDLAAANDDMAESIDLANAAMNSGNVSAMEQQYRAMRDEVNDTQKNIDNFWTDMDPINNWDAIVGKFGGLFGGADIESQKDALSELGGELTAAGGSTTGYASATDRAAGAAARAAANVRQLSNQLADQAANARGAFGAQTNWAQAVRNARDAVKDGEKGLRGNSQAAIDNRQVLQGLADAWSQMPPKVQNNVQRFQAARREFIGTARDMGATAGRARELANRMLGVPKRVVSKVVADTRDANKDLNLTEKEVRRLAKQTARPQVRPEVSKAQRDLGSVRQQFERFRNQRVRPTIDANDRPAMGKLRTLQAAQRRFNGSQWRSTLDLNSSPAEQKSSQMTANVRRFSGLKGTAQVDVNNAAGMRALGQVDSRMKATGAMKATTQVDSNTAGANNALSGHSSYLTGLNGRTANTYVNNYITTIRRTRTERAGGGPVFGPGTATSDSIPAMLSNGEYVVRTAAVNRYGLGFLDDVNQMRLAAGGLVAPPPWDGSRHSSVLFASAEPGKDRYAAGGFTEGRMPYRGGQSGTPRGAGVMRIVDAQISGRLDVDTGKLEGRMRGIAVEEIEDHGSFAGSRRGRVSS